MAVASITSDYTGRRKDISILQYPDPTFSPESVTSLSMSQALKARQTVLPKFGNQTRYCAGVQKLIQKYAIILLTGLGSQPFYAAFGTDFMPNLQAGVSPTGKLLVTQYFMLASYAAVNVLKAYQINNAAIVPLDERIANAELLDVVLQGDYVAFKVAISTEAGDAVDFIVPLPK